MKPDAITALFAEAAAAVTPIVGNPTDDDLTAIREILTPLLLGVPYDTAGPHNLVGLIMPKAAYRSAYSVAFKYPARPELYDGNIADDATPVVRARMEAAHTNKRSDYECYDAAERATVKFLRDLVDETWYKDLKDAEAFYTEVTAFDLLDHLDRNCGGLHAIDLVHLNTEMMGYYAEAEGIPEYINMLEDAQRKAERAKMPIADVQLVAIASTAVLASQDYVRATEDWEALTNAQKTWTKWKSSFRVAHLARKRQLLASGGAGPTHAGAHAASATGPSSLLSPGTIDRLDGYLDNLASAATSERSTLAQLIECNASLTKSYEALAVAYTALAKKPAPAAAATKGKAHKSKARPEPTYSLDGYCWSHGYKVATTHNSLTCNYKNDGHQDGATRANTMNGSSANKGWGSA